MEERPIGLRVDVAQKVYLAVIVVFRANLSYPQGDKRNIKEMISKLRIIKKHLDRIDLINFETKENQLRKIKDKIRKTKFHLYTNIYLI